MIYLLSLLSSCHSAAAQPSNRSTLGPKSHTDGFSLTPPRHTHTHRINALKQALIGVIKCTNAKSHTEHCPSLLVPSFSFHMHASADVITVSAASAVQRCETKSCSLLSIIKSFLGIGQLTVASCTVPFNFHQSCHPYCKRGKDCQTISACFHHSQRLIM